MREKSFRDQITEDFKIGKIGIVNGWLVEYLDGADAEPLADLYRLMR